MMRQRIGMFELIARLRRRSSGRSSPPEASVLPRETVERAAPCDRMDMIERSAPLRHAFVIVRLGAHDGLDPFRHRYLCLRCRWSFLVDARGRVAAIDGAGRPLADAEAARRLASFADGPCPGGSRRLDAKIISIR